MDAARTFHFALLVGTLAVSGCASSWALRSAAPDAAMTWPYAPAEPRITYERALTGVTRDTDAGSLLHAIAFGGDDGERDSFLLPVAVAVGPGGRLAVADLGRRCVHLYLPAERRYLRLTGSEPLPMVSPVGLAFDELARLYVSDSAGRVFAYGAAGDLRFALDKAGDRPLQRPTGLVWSPRARVLYVADTLASQIDGFDEQGALALSFGGRGEAPGQLNFPTHLAWAAPGELYVTDAMNFRVQIFDEGGRPVGVFGRHGDGSGDLAMPKGIAVDRRGVVYVVDGLFDNVQLFDRAGSFLLTLGGRGTGFGEFWLPSGAFVDGEDRLYVCDTYNRRIQVFRIVAGDERARS